MPETIYESGEYLRHNPDWHAADAPFKAQWIAAILKRNAVSCTSLAEVGAGSGEVLVELKRAIPAATMAGYDISPQAHAIAAPKATDGLEFHCIDYLSTQLPPADVLMAIDVFEHVEDYMGFLRLLRGRAQWTVFHIPLDLSVQGLFRGSPILYSRKAVGHLHYFFKDTALATLEDCGYEVVDWNYTHGAEMLPNRQLRTRLFNFPRKIMRAINQDLAVRVMGGASLMVLARSAG